MASTLFSLTHMTNVLNVDYLKENEKLFDEY